VLGFGAPSTSRPEDSRFRATLSIGLVSADRRRKRPCRLNRRSGVSGEKATHGTTNCIKIHSFTTLCRILNSVLGFAYLPRCRFPGPSNVYQVELTSLKLFTEQKSVHGFFTGLCNLSAGHWREERRSVRVARSARRLDGWVRHRLSLREISGRARMREETQKLEMPVKQACISATSLYSLLVQSTPVGMTLAISATALWAH
jgi:hypothetical protein